MPISDGPYTHHPQTTDPTARPPRRTLALIAAGSLLLSALAIGTAWTEPSAGLGAGAAPPSTSSALGVLKVAAYASPSARASHWNVYVGTASGTETLQAPVAFGSGWTEPGTGLVSGAALPIVDTSPLPAGPVTAQFSFYFRCHFDSDSQDMEKFADKFWTIGGSESQKGSGEVKISQTRPEPL